MSRVLTTARADFRRVRRHRLVWLAVVLLGLMYLPSKPGSATPEINPLGEFLLLDVYGMLTYALVVVGAVTYNSVAGERANGRVRFLLGLSATRRGVVLGTLLSRLAVVVLAVTPVLALGSLLVIRGYGLDALVPSVVAAAWMLCYAVVWTAVGVGYSAAFSSSYRALGALVVTFAVFSTFVPVWEVLVRPFFSLVFTGSLAVPAFDSFATAPLWLRVTDRLSPVIGFFRLAQWSLSFVTGVSTETSPLLNLFGSLVFVAFAVTPLVVGVRRFERGDLTAGETDLVARLQRRRRRVVRTASFTRLVPGSRLVDSRVWTVAHADFRRAFGNWLVLGAVALAALVAVPSLWQGLGTSSVFTPAEEVARLSFSFGLSLLLLGVVLGVGAVAGERETGTVRFTLGLPTTRRDLLLGKLVSRVTVVVAALGLLLVVALALTLTRFEAPPLAVFAVVAGEVLLRAVVWTTTCVGVSAAVSSRYRALGGVLGVYLLFGGSVGLWQPIVQPLLRSLTAGFSQPDGSPGMAFHYLDHLNPFIALSTLRKVLVAAVDARGLSDYVTPGLVAFSAIVVVAFAAGSVAIGLRRFERADLY